MVFPELALYHTHPTPFLQFPGILSFLLFIKINFWFWLKWYDSSWIEFLVSITVTLILFCDMFFLTCICTWHERWTVMVSFLLSSLKVGTLSNRLGYTNHRTRNRRKEKETHQINQMFSEYINFKILILLKNPLRHICKVFMMPCFLVVQWLSHVRLFATPWTAARQASLSFTISWSLLKLRSIQLLMPSNHLILCCPLLLLPSILPSIRIFSSESALPIRWPKYWSFSISPSRIDFL